MPNWCENDLDMYADEGAEAEKQLQEAVKIFQADKPFQAIKPMPESESKDWYKWHYENWGTKWDLNKDDACIDHVDKRWAQISFSTAWAPPQKVILELSKQFPLLEINMMSYEAGMAFCCAFKCRAGKIINDETMEYYGSRGG